ncbi:hypothetical protein BDA96_06G007600 [Sorghum bicolor]|jgi:hypothetical protein|uniref:Late embryogenesis abundant protein LEA-2 subgroup domain-containing protein n=2 Tax=Sorghum bicolor TaxID=4558 RepID=A0A921QMM9_SORBI|nr:uncharacterized protein LOC8080253 [Sorghum bicolor]KAG0524894.1 hypothetical protein BDA96_06G007600 [Sorghum bicolor]OQU81071.1 hypothetical protein SORBI_3006G007001 [Sorghum bicolor]|eukprot:XP_002447419.1 uncharacterized protein LOC8080253 [Sorghum bicolor]
MAKQLLILVATIIALMLRATYARIIQINPAGSVYHLLELNNLPQGLLPLGVQSYVLGAGGALDVKLSSECNAFVTFSGRKFEFVYATEVNGVIKSGSISSVSGVSVQVEFVWHVLHEVTRAGKQLKIQLGNNTLSFPVSAFTEIPSCNRGIESSTDAFA